MIVKRSAITLGRRVFTRLPHASSGVRAFSSSVTRFDAAKPPAGSATTHVKSFDEVRTESDLIPAGAKPGTVPTDIEQATGLERLEILGKMQGVDIFDMKPLDASRLGTLENPIPVKSFGDEQYAGCTGYPADSHTVLWLTISRERPVGRCPECGNVVKMEYVGPQDDGHGHGHDHGHDHHAHVPKKTFADFVKPEYRW